MIPRAERPAPLEPPFDFSRLPATVWPLVGTPPLPSCELCVAIPVHNEEADIKATLRALAAQVGTDGKRLNPARYEVLILANNCTDRTGDVVRAFASEHPDLRLHLVEIALHEPHAHVGAARRLVMDEACRRLESIGRRKGVIATTDGDTRVRPGWVAANLAEIAAGADAVGGRILAEPEQVAALLPGTRRFYRLDTHYRTLRAAYETILNPGEGNPWPRHHHCFGASLAVTAAAYRAAGGLPVRRCLEDMAFTEALERLDVRVRQSPAVNVLTSLRIAGRVDIGLSGTLSKWTRAATAGEPLMITSPDAIAREALNRRYLRELWRKPFPPGSVGRAAVHLGTPADALEQFRRQARSAGELCQLVCWHHRDTRTGPYALPLMEVRAAIAELRRLVGERRGELRALTLTPARTNPTGIFPRDERSDAATLDPWPPRTCREPDRPSADSRVRTGSSEPAADGHPVPVG